MAETRDHVKRPDLPWRLSTITECGRRLDDVASWITRDELIAKLRRDGQRRTAFDVCMTCLTTGRQWPTFEDDPVQALSREYYGATDPALAVELRALALLVSAHREEFDEAVQGLRATSSLTDRRRRRGA